MGAGNLAILPGAAEAEVLVCDPGLSFWGGVDPATGRVIDAHHPLHGASLAGRIVAMPTSRGSCTGSGVLLELALNGHAPAALVFREGEDVLTLGALIASKLFGNGLPVVRLAPEAWARLGAEPRAVLAPDRLRAGALDVTLEAIHPERLALTDADRAMLAGAEGQAVQAAMAAICVMAAQQGAAELTDITRGHIDGCIYASPANLRFAESMREMGARVRVPTTMNAISVDHAHWRAQGVPPDFGGPAQRLADAYVAMGARPSFTCAPYLLADAPARGEAIAWAESNAVVYANSVLGARTVKHPDFMDLFIAMTGRAPLSGVYLDAERRATRIIEVDLPAGHDDALWPLLGYLAGAVAPDRIPLLRGLEAARPSDDDLKALCAAFGTTSAAAMLHVAGHTPEAGAVDPAADHAAITRAGLARAWAAFNDGSAEVELVAIGSPHASVAECRRLAALVAGRKRADGVDLVVTCGRDTLAAITADGTLAALTAFGARVHPDLCWCSITEPVFPPAARTVMTNSGKYAHYGPGLTGRAMRFGSMADCVAAACTGRAPDAPPYWLA
jgi:predicted aconitase/predicted aconitase with swiveling domain